MAFKRSHRERSLRPGIGCHRDSSHGGESGLNAHQWRPRLQPQRQGACSTCVRRPKPTLQEERMKIKLPESQSPKPLLTFTGRGTRVHAGQNDRIVLVVGGQDQVVGGAVVLGTGHVEGAGNGRRIREGQHSRHRTVSGSPLRAQDDHAIVQADVDLGRLQVDLRGHAVGIALEEVRVAVELVPGASVLQRRGTRELTD